MDLKSYRNMRQTGGKDFTVQFMKKLAEVQKEYQLKRIPLCTSCAWIDFRDSVARVKNEIERQMGYGPGAHIPEDTLGNFKEFNELPDKFDFSKYVKGWKVGGEAENRETRVNAVGEKFNIVTGYHINFVCNRYGHGNSVDVSKDELENIKKLVSDLDKKV